jgi:hypothetical protein
MMSLFNVVFIALVLVYVLMLGYAVLAGEYSEGEFLYLMFSVVFVALADIYYEVGRKLTGVYMLVIAVLLALGVIV